VDEQQPASDSDAFGVAVATAGVALAAARLLSRAPGMSPLLQRGREEVETATHAALTGPYVERLAAELEPEIDRWMQKFVESDQFERALEQVMTSPKVRQALTQQTRSFTDELVDDVRRRLFKLDERYARIPSRAVAFLLDLTLAQIAFLVVTALFALVGSLVGGLRPHWLFGALAGSGWTLLVGAYFVFFWTLRGQTPGMRLMNLRVVCPTRPLGVGRATLRFLALLIAIIPLFAGFIPILFDKRRRGFHDFVARTFVVYAT
jgi:uncharacterized RDD family membrane protein YckC